MDQGLKEIVYNRLLATSALDQSWSELVMMACEGPEELAGALGGSTTKLAAPASSSATDIEPPGAYLQSITVQGFRGIGPETTLQLTPGPGLTLIVGRNGSGKSSFAEGLEVLLTGDSYRWLKRSKVWKDGWRNLHHGHPAIVEAEFLVEGRGTTRVSREWGEGSSEVAEGTTSVEVAGKPKAALETLGWESPLSSYRPFLSYNELGSLLDDGPTKLYDALSKVLGLEDLVEAGELLRSARLERERVGKEITASATRLVFDLKDHPDAGSDERFGGAIAALESKSKDLATLGGLATSSGTSSVGEIEQLRHLAELPCPTPEDVVARVGEIEAAVAKISVLQGSDSDRSREVAQLLTASLTFHEAHGESDCPVCGTIGVLDGSWKDRTRTQIDRLEKEASSAITAHRALDDAMGRASHLMTSVPSALDPASELGLDDSLLRAQWNEWALGASLKDPEQILNHLATFAPFNEAALSFKATAAKEVQTREDVWRPYAERIAAWLQEAKSAAAESERISDLKAAEKWMKDATAEIRNDRFAPVGDKAVSLWKRLRQQSNVELAKIELVGSINQRKVSLEVTVDGSEGAALSVMSQGELNALALSLFLPRATLPESPFRYVVIDDPVQSMDPSRVDGLAQALDDVAKTRQIVVFTHDDRLPESVRRLGIEADMISVTRRSNSVVEMRKTKDPVAGHIDDAFTIVLTKEMDDDVKRRVVPGFCRSALEAACVAVIRKRRLTKGVAHAEVEDELSAGKKLTHFAALALFDDSNRTGDVMSKLNQYGGWAGDLFKALNKGTHDSHGGDLKTLVRNTESLCQKIGDLS